MYSSDAITALAPRMRALLRDLLRIPSVSGDEATITRFVRDYLADAGLETDLFETDEAALSGHPVATSKHLPLARRPTLVATLPGVGPSLIFNAHSDVVAAPDPERWTHPPFAGVEVDGRFFGRGACDVKGPLVSAIWAMLALRDSDLPHGPILLELVPGEEDCVTLGTLTSVVRGYSADGCIVLEPTECQPRCASRAGRRFEITCHGRSVHGTVKWLGDDAIATARRVLDRLDRFQSDAHDPAADPLYSAYPIARPVTVDRIDGGDWQGMVADRCHIGGYLELLPLDDGQDWERRFTTAIGGDRISVNFVERYPGHRTDPDHRLCQVAESLRSDPPFHWVGFNSGCEAGLRANLLGTPTLVWGPGSLAQAHAVDEFIDFDDVCRVARRFTDFATRYSAIIDPSSL